MKVPRSTRSTAYGRGAGVSWDWARARLSGPYKLKLTTSAPLPLRSCLREMDFVSVFIFALLILRLSLPYFRPARLIARITRRVRSSAAIHSTITACKTSLLRYFATATNLELSQPAAVRAACTRGYLFFG